MSKDIFDHESQCSFCGRRASEVKHLITGTSASVCDQCIQSANEIIRNSQYSQYRKGKFKLPKPVEIKEYLDQFVIGQEKAKIALSVAVYNHYKRLQQLEKGIVKADDDVDIEKSNVLFVGQTGTGKTLMAKTIAKLLHVPFTIVDATIFTEAGYVGEDVESILSRLLQVCDYDEKAAERGIVYIDEIDKIARKQDNPSITRDVSGEGVQQGMLKMLEGSEVLVPPQGGRKHPEQKLVKINTHNILFICGGAFDGIEKIIARRVNTQVIGYNKAEAEEIDKENLLQYVSPQDIKTFGLIPELVGRVPVVAHLDPLDVDSLRRILTEPRNALVKQYEKIFALEGIKLKLHQSAIDLIAQKAFEFKLGARGLRSLCETILTDAMFDLPAVEGDKGAKRQLVINADYVKEKLEGAKRAKLKAA